MVLGAFGILTYDDSILNFWIFKGIYTRMGRCVLIVSEFSLSILTKKQTTAADSAIFLIKLYTFATFNF